MIKAMFTAAAIVGLSGGAVWAEGDLSRANPIVVTLEMGSNVGGMFFAPNAFTFETGQAYIWRLTNVDDGTAHELAINEMRERIFTRKLEISDADGNLIAEIKGDINEVEIGPGQTVDWYFVPVQTDGPIEIACEIPGHREAGMFGNVTIY
jgi:uncharacterized cupredoxin-like copper-binding protein